MKNIIKKINIIIILIFLVGLMFSNYSQALSAIFSDADDFLSKRRASK